MLFIFCTSPETDLWREEKETESKLSITDLSQDNCSSSSSTLKSSFLTTERWFQGPRGTHVGGREGVQRLVTALAEGGEQDGVTQGQ